MPAFPGDPPLGGHNDLCNVVHGSTAPVKFHAQPTVRTAAQGQDPFRARFPHDPRPPGKTEHGGVVYHSSLSKHREPIRAKSRPLGCAS